MSFVFALALNKVGLLISDTQLNFKYKDGSTNISEIEPIEINIKGIGSIVWKNNFRKIGLLSNGFISGAGDAVFCRKVIDSVVDIVDGSDFSEIIARVSSDIKTPLIKCLEDSLSEFEKTTFIVLQTDLEKPKLSTFSSIGKIINTGQDYVAAWPPELTQSKIDYLTSMFLPKLETTKSSLNSAINNIKVLSQLASEVDKFSQTVGKKIEIGINLVENKSIKRGHIIYDSEEIASMSEDEVLSLINYF